MSIDHSVQNAAADEAEEESFPASDPPSSWAGPPSGYDDMPSSPVRGGKDDPVQDDDDEPDEDHPSEPRPFHPPALDPESP
jgi:hypothetical protein